LPIHAISIDGGRSQVSYRPWVAQLGFGALTTTTMTAIVGGLTLMACLTRRAKAEGRIKVVAMEVGYEQAW